MKADSAASSPALAAGPPTSSNQQLTAREASVLPVTLRIRGGARRSRGILVQTTSAGALTEPEFGSVCILMSVAVAAKRTAVWAATRGRGKMDGSAYSPPDEGSSRSGAEPDTNTQLP